MRSNNINKIHVHNYLYQSHCRKKKHYLHFLDLLLYDWFPNWESVFQICFIGHKEQSLPWLIHTNKISLLSWEKKTISIINRCWTEIYVQNAQDDYGTVLHDCNMPYHIYNNIIFSIIYYLVPVFLLPFWPGTISVNSWALLINMASVALWALKRSTTSWSATSVIRSQLTTRTSVCKEMLRQKTAKWDVLLHFVAARFDTLG